MSDILITWSSVISISEKSEISLYKWNVKSHSGKYKNLHVENTRYSVSILVLKLGDFATCMGPPILNILNTANTNQCMVQKLSQKTETNNNFQGDSS